MAASSRGLFREPAQELPLKLVHVPDALAAETVPNEIARAGVVGIEVVPTRVNRYEGDF